MGSASLSHSVPRARAALAASEGTADGLYAAAAVTGTVTVPGTLAAAALRARADGWQRQARLCGRGPGRSGLSLSPGSPSQAEPRLRAP